jgi:type I restriction enzyme R subunit
MATHNEIEFEKEICEHLAAHGWLYSETDEAYDAARALVPTDVLGWLEDTQPDAYAKAVKPNGDVAKQQAALLDRLVATLDIPLDNGGGTLNVLRNGFQVIGAGKLQMATFKPETTLNQAENEKYAKMRVRVMRQVHFSTTDARSIDLVLFINGLPVATLELKTDFTQSIDNAIEQYKKDRNPDGTYKGVKGVRQPLLGFGNRAFVHFAVSNSEVAMTTRLAGNKTHFLPFNMGFDDGAGNPPAHYVEGKASTSSTAYLWERVLDKDAWLNIVGKMMMVETSVKHDPITGEQKKSTVLLFPRFHQWEVVTGLTKAVLDEGPGQRYLVQHSAGSGKTNSIAWLASRLARLQDETDGAWAKVFDKVIVVVDRNVLDGQLQEAIRKIDGQQDIVAAINEDDVRKAGAKSKSDLLAKALLNQHSHIIAVTIQTFPFAMDAIRANKGLKGKKFAVIADEAHSSQSGQIASKLKAVLTADEVKEIEDGGEIDVETVLAAETAERAESKNISYFAFTATPKAKTLELFGRPGIDGKPVPFHVYSMKQAIAEEFILNVLRGYQTYDTAFKIAQAVKDGEDSTEVDQSAATKGLMKWVKLHPTNITQKVQIIVEHFHDNVVDLLDGHAKAMVVTDSRKAAVRYKLAMDEYIAKRRAADPGYDYRTLVAFSGAVEDPESGPEPFTEATMNPGVFDLAKEFAKDEYKVMLVANKFQTGFDQPLLSAMYVDKKLSGVTAVQTLSRLNRTYTTPSGEKKRQTFVLDFVNSTETIREAFEAYYTDAFLETATDPYLVVNIATKLAQANIFTEQQVRDVAEIWLLRKGHNKLAAAISPAKHQFEVRYAAAIDQNDKAAQDELDQFRKDVGTYVRLYDFMSQIIDYGDTYLEALSIFLRLLERVISEQSWAADIDLSDVTLTAIKHTPGIAVDIALDGGQGLTGVTAAGSATKKDPKMVALRDVIERLNDLFGSDEFSEAENTSFVETLLRRLLLDERIRQRIRVNNAKQFEESPGLADMIRDAIGDSQGEQNKRADYFYGTGVDIDNALLSIIKMLYVVGSGMDENGAPMEVDA